MLYSSPDAHDRIARGKSQQPIGIFSVLVGCHKYGDRTRAMEVTSRKVRERREGDSSHQNQDDSAASARVDYYQRRTLVVPPGFLRRLASRLAFPLLILVSRETALKIHLTPLDDERTIEALRRVRGRLLDIGCGSNTLVHSYGNGVGADIFPWQGCDVVLTNAADLPFRDGEFDTVSYLACLNHISNREESLRAAYRVMKEDGQLIITMIGPRLGVFVHWLRHRHDPDDRERSIDHKKELLGMNEREIVALLNVTGCRLVSKSRFVARLNNLYIAVKA